MKLVTWTPGQPLEAHRAIVVELESSIGPLVAHFTSGEHVLIQGGREAAVPHWSDHNATVTWKDAAWLVAVHLFARDQWRLPEDWRLLAAHGEIAGFARVSRRDGRRVTLRQEGQVARLLAGVAAEYISACPAVLRLAARMAAEAEISLITRKIAKLDDERHLLEDRRVQLTSEAGYERAIGPLADPGSV